MARSIASWIGIGGCASDPFPVAAFPSPPPGCSFVTASGTTLSTVRLPKLSLEAVLPRTPNLERRLSAASPTRPPFSVVAGFRRSLRGGFSDFDFDFSPPAPDATRAAAPNRAALPHSLRASRAYSPGDAPVALFAARFALADFFVAEPALRVALDLVAMASRFPVRCPPRRPLGLLHRLVGRLADGFDRVRDAADALADLVRLLRRLVDVVREVPHSALHAGTTWLRQLGHAEAA